MAIWACRPPPNSLVPKRTPQEEGGPQRARRQTEQGMCGMQHMAPSTGAAKEGRGFC